jgi:4,5-DOPA dioxygenase extradiol
MTSLSRRDLGMAAAALFASRTGTASAESIALAPVLFVSHGTPLYVRQDPARFAELSAWGARLPKPRALVVMTPHFASRTPLLGHEGPGRALYDLPEVFAKKIPPGTRYATPSAEELGRRLRGLLPGLLPGHREGLDHTTWMPLALLYPKADVPVIELGYRYETDAKLFALGRTLAPLRREGIVFVASGGMTHNLASVDLSQAVNGAERASSVPVFSRDFDAWARERLAAKDVDSLVDWRTRAPAQRLAHPDDGAHFRVLLVALGMADGVTAKFPVQGFESGLSKTCVELG